MRREIRARATAETLLLFARRVMPSDDDDGDGGPERGDGRRHRRAYGSGRGR